ncbi:ABC transporter ATP-binding protein [Arachidicoccus sp.]|uniref:ABC transporter ATP-binding protein n=1 Tax=Arachidicoccus sp. TaxID=1872624 RepID=UPI003D248E19
MIRVSDFSKSYGALNVLDVESLLLANGIHWIKGKNGTGKSTFLKCIAGMLRYHGEINVEGISLRKEPRSIKRIVTYAEAEPRFPTFLTGMDILNIYIKSKQGDAKNTTQMLEELFMENYIHMPISSYSSGMLKKVSIVASFIGNVKWILLDEPLNALDSETVAIVYKWINNAYLKMGTSFLLSSHQLMDKNLLCSVIEHQILDKNIVGE